MENNKFMENNKINDENLQQTEYVELKLLDFNFYDCIDEDNYNKFKDSKKFVVQMFGLNEKRETFSLIIDDFKPYFYIEVGDDWKHSDKNIFISHFRNKLGNYYENSIVDVKFIKRKKLYMFDNGKYYKFILIKFANNAVFNKAKNLWYISGKSEDGEYSRKLKPNGYEYTTEGKTYNLKIYEAQIPPLLRLFHKNNLSPSGWIKFALNKAKIIHAKKTFCNFEYNVPYKCLESMPDKNTLAPYKILSFDIEASSSHGDFPLPIKNYKKLADDLLQYNNFTKADFNEEILIRAINTAFEFDNLENINKVYTKSKVTQKQISGLINMWLNMSVSDIKKLKPNNSNFDEENEDDPECDELSEDDDDFDGVNNDDNNEGYVEIEAKFIPKKQVKEYKNKTKKDDLLKIIDILNDHDAVYKSKLKVLNKSFYIFPQLEGDKCTFIGYTFRNYGQKEPYLKYCGVLNGCEIEKNNDSIKINTFEKESDLLLDFTAMINKEDPDIIIGYNITGFDYEFMYKRAMEVGCLNKFIKMSRNKDEECFEKKYDWKKKEETKSITQTMIVLAAGTFNLKYIRMNGRLNIDVYNYFRRGFQLPRYKLDYVANHFIGDDVISYEFDEENDKTIIKSKNLSGLELYSYIHFEEIGYSNNFYKDGAKFEIIELDKKEKTFSVQGIQDFDKSKKLRWGLAKDDVTHHDIFRLTNGSDIDRGIVAKYCIKDCKLVDDLLDKTDIITSYVEMANICSVPIDFIHFRGQGIKLTSYVSKKCQEKETLMPVIDKVENDGGYEGAIVLKPKTRIYLEDPVACVDYSSLYPSSMISENISHDSKVWTKEYDLEDNLIDETGYKDDDENYIYDNIDELKYVNVTYDTFKYVRKTPKAALSKIKCGYKVCRFAQFNDDKKAIMPSILEELLAARKYTRKQIPLQNDDFMKNVLDKRQLSIKETANSLYGQCGARTSSFYEKDVAASTTATGRKLLIYGKTVIEECFYNKLIKLKNGEEVKTYAEYVYGDSVTNDTPITIKNHEKNIEILTIENIAKKYGNDEWLLFQEHGKEDKQYCILKYPIYVWTEQSWTLIKNVIRHVLASHKFIVRVLTHTGCVDVTDDHSLLTPDCKEISPKSVSIGTKLLHNTLNINNEIANFNNNISEKEAKIYGFFFGDGSCGCYKCKSGSKSSWALNNKNINLLNIYLDLCKEVYPQFEWKIYNTIKSSNVYKLTFNSNKYGENTKFIQNYRNNCYFENCKIIPSFIINASINIRQAFWEGLYDAHGDKDYNGYTRIDQKNKISASYICLLANSIGFKTSINSRSDKQNIFRITCTKSSFRKDCDAIKKLDLLNYDGFVYDLTTENHHFGAGIGSMIVHNTDSVFFKFNLKTADDSARIINKEALIITIELAKRAGELASKFLKKPHDLEYEKTFWPWCLLSKKRYDGILYEEDPNKGKRKFMGNVLKRRDNAAIVKDIYGETMHIILQEKDIKKSLGFVRNCMDNIIEGKYHMDKLIVCKSLRGYYKNPNQIAHKVLAERIGLREAGNKPGAGDRIDYVYIKNSNKKALQGEKIETPKFIKDNELPIDYGHYITNQIMKPLQQLFALELENIYEYKVKYPTTRKWDDQVNKIKEKYPDEEKFEKKYEELKCKEIKALIFDEYIKKVQ